MQRSVVDPPFSFQYSIPFCSRYLPLLLSCFRHCYHCQIGLFAHCQLRSNTSTRKGCWWHRLKNHKSYLEQEPVEEMIVLHQNEWRELRVLVLLW
jgi:hypothetical protein